MTDRTNDDQENRRPDAPDVDQASGLDDRAEDIDTTDEGDDRVDLDAMQTGSHKNLPDEAIAEAARDGTRMTSPTDATPHDSRTVGNSEGD